MKETNTPMALVTVLDLGDNPGLQEAALQLGVPVEDIDAVFGLVPIDATAGMYCAQVVAGSLPEGFEKRDPFQGPFANPGIAPLNVSSGGGKKDR